MAALFSLGLLVYFLLVFRGRPGGAPELAKLLWAIYFLLGISGMIIAVTDVLRPVFPPNYASSFFLTLCVLIGIGSFHAFHARDAATVIGPVRGQRLIEAVLVLLQSYAIVFFLPFAAMSLSGDAKENRLDLANKIELLGSYGLFNTVAGAASQLFAASLIMACIRLCQPVGAGRSNPRAAALIAASLSYVIYIFAYVGRDGAVYWLMTALAVFLIFRPHMEPTVRRRIVATGTAVGAAMMLPFLVITVSRFSDWDHGSGWSFLEYFGTQIQTFSDYSSIDRPVTLGVMNFSMFIEAGCKLVGQECEGWDSLKEFIFDLYLAQGKEPWLFGTYVSDFTGDFGYGGTLLALTLFALLCHLACRPGRLKHPLTLARLLLIVFLFLVPYWGVFFFRFSIINGFIAVNLAFIAFVWLLQHSAWRGRLAMTTARGSARALVRSKAPQARPAWQRPSRHATVDQNSMLPTPVRRT
jgi:hypothetical protein